MTSFAANTSVPVSRTRVEIEDLLQKWKASRIAVATEPDRAHVLFTIGRWSVKFTMPLPTEEQAKKQKDGRGYYVGPTARQKWMDQTTRTKWRALLLTIKAKLVSVENGVETFEEAFMAHLVLPGTGGQTMGQQALPPLRDQAPQLTDGGVA